MIYQLPTGKIVYISLEVYLDLTEADIQFMIAHANGNSPNNPFHGSAMKGFKEEATKPVDSHDKSIDYWADDDEAFEEPVDLDNLPEDI
jgi:hypothetical protein